MRTLSKDEVVASYRRMAPVYDTWARLTESRARRRVLALAELSDGERVLEVAVGTGSLFVELVRANPHGHTQGVDLTPEMLAQARAKAERVGAGNWDLRLGDAYALDYPDASFDLLVNCYMFDLLPQNDFDRVLGEFRRVLRPGGRLVLANLASTQGPAYRIWDWIYRRNPAWLGGCRGVSLAEPLRRNGFTVDTEERVVQLGFASEIVLARKAAK